MEPREKRLWEKAKAAPANWDPIEGGREAWVCFKDDLTYDLGKDHDGNRFKVISERMMSGKYYPPDAVRFSGAFKDEHRDLKVGDRLLQAAPLFGMLGGPLIYSSCEIFVAEHDDDRCRIGYVTTKFHLARGIWSAELVRKEGRLSLRVTSTASPASFLFWIGLFYARFLQKRARIRAVQEFELV